MVGHQLLQQVGHAAFIGLQLNDGRLIRREAAASATLSAMDARSLDVGFSLAESDVGTNGVGKCWYGFANGVVWPEEGPYPPVPEAPNDFPGWWARAGPKK